MTPHRVYSLFLTSLGVLQDDVAVDPLALFTEEAAARVGLFQAEPEVVPFLLPPAQVGVLQGPNSVAKNVGFKFCLKLWLETPFCYRDMSELPVTDHLLSIGKIKSTTHFGTFTQYSTYIGNLR